MSKREREREHGQGEEEEVKERKKKCPSNDFYMSDHWIRFNF